MAIDYVYKNSEDTKRFRVFKRETSWDYDIFTANGGFYNFSSDAGDSFRTKKDAKQDIKTQHNCKLISINPENVTSGW